MPKFAAGNSRRNGIKDHVELKGKAYIAGAYEHPTRKAPDKSCAQLHAEVALGALRDAGLSHLDVDGYFCAGDAPGLGPLSLCDYLGLRVRHLDSTDTGGSAPLAHVAHAAQAITAGKCRVALITLAGVPRSQPAVHAYGVRSGANTPEAEFEGPYNLANPAAYALAARRHMHEFSTTPAQLAWIKVAASVHAQYNPNAMLRAPVTVEEVLASPLVADPLHKLDCCVVSDGGGALLVVAPEVMRSLARPPIRVRGAGESPKGTLAGDVDLTFTGAAWSGRAAFEEAAVTPSDIDYASIYDSFTITVLLQLEDLGFCAKGQGGRFVADGGLIAGTGRLPVNTDGGGLCNNHPSNRGGMTKAIEAVRQLRGEAHPAVQVKDCRLALVSAIGGNLATRHGAATLILERA
jgi:acetyl-CoA C-acetyltransferase